jgi:hypothetical protein
MEGQWVHGSIPGFGFCAQEAALEVSEVAGHLCSFYLGLLLRSMESLKAVERPLMLHVLHVEHPSLSLQDHSLPPERRRLVRLFVPGLLVETQSCQTQVAQPGQHVLVNHYDLPR